VLIPINQKTGKPWTLKEAKEGYMGMQGIEFCADSDTSKCNMVSFSLCEECVFGDIDIESENEIFDIIERAELEDKLKELEL